MTPVRTAGRLNGRPGDPRARETRAPLSVRGAMVFGMTGSDPKAALHLYLQAGREALLWKLDGLSEYDVRRPLTPTGTNLLGLVKHLASVEVGYFGVTFGRPFPERLGAGPAISVPERSSGRAHRAARSARPDSAPGMPVLRKVTEVARHLDQRFGSVAPSQPLTPRVASSRHHVTAHPHVGPRPAHTQRVWMRTAR
ncbi:hypothetical protein GCM10025787_37170 [Saccharopolyspora rosea]